MNNKTQLRFDNSPRPLVHTVNHVNRFNRASRLVHKRRHAADVPDNMVREISVLLETLQSDTTTVINLDISRLRVFQRRDNTDGVVFQMPTMEDPYQTIVIAFAQ